MKIKQYKRLGRALTLISLFLSPAVVSAATSSGNTTISSVIGSVISMTTSTTVGINITPASGGSTSSNSDTVTVTTNNSAGYTLTLSNSDATSNLVSGSNTIGPHTGTQASPTALANNKWGYRVDSVGGFGAGPTTQETNAAGAGARTWAGVPVLASPNTIKTTATHSTSGNATTVWYGVRADQTQPTGTYTDTVTYTATTN